MYSATAAVLQSDTQVMMFATSTEALLQEMASEHKYQESGESHDEVAGAMKSIGSPTNNMLLQTIQSEIKHQASELAMINANIAGMRSVMEERLSKICDILEASNQILASQPLQQSQHLMTQQPKGLPGGQSWYYQGTRLSSKYHVYACIVSHLIEMVQAHMDSRSLFYPDSVDCDFKSMHNAVRVVSTERCSIPSVEYKNSILVKDRDSQPLEYLYPLISSTDPRVSTMLLESHLCKIINAVTRPVIQEVEWIRQRLCHLDGILSKKQTDVLKSIGNPLILSDTDYELNWKQDVLKPAPSHPLTKDIAELSPTQKNQYIKERMKNKSILEAYGIASDFSTAKKNT